jgi:hypothetical protein
MTFSSISTIAKYRKFTRCRTILLPLMKLIRGRIGSLGEPHYMKDRFIRGTSLFHHLLRNICLEKFFIICLETQKSNNSWMLQQLAFHTQQNIKATSTQDLDPRSLANNDHPSVYL